MLTVRPTGSVLTGAPGSLYSTPAVDVFTALYDGFYVFRLTADLSTVPPPGNSPIQLGTLTVRSASEVVCATGGPAGGTGMVWLYAGDVVRLQNMLGWSSTPTFYLQSGRFAQDELYDEP